jgi:hypothetical protein
LLRNLRRQFDRASNPDARLFDGRQIAELLEMRRNSEAADDFRWRRRIQRCHPKVPRDSIAPPTDRRLFFIRQSNSLLSLR